LLLYHLDWFYRDLRQTVPVLYQPVWNSARIGRRRSTTTTTKNLMGCPYCIHILKLHILCLCCWLIDFHELICFKYVICLQFVEILQLIKTLHILCLFCKFRTRGFCSHTLYSALNRSLDCWAFREKFTTIHRQMVGFSRVSRVRVSVRIRVRFSFSGANLNRKTLGGELLPDALKRQ